MLLRFWKDERGTTAIEYALIGSVVVLAIVGGVLSIGTKLNLHSFQPVASALS